MGPHVTRLGEGLITIGMWANVRLATRVVVQVRLQMMLLGEGFRAQGTAEGLNAGVEAVVQGHVAPVCKRFAAHGALIGLLAAVGAHVLFQEHFPGESLAAFGAFVRLDSGVDPYVHVEGYPLVKGLWAVRALVLLAIPVDLHVATQVALVVEGLPTLGALRRKLLGAPMHGQVVLVVSQLREALAAVRALITGRFVRLFMSLQKDKLNGARIKLF